MSAPQRPFDRALRTLISERLSAFPRHEAEDPALRPAAVALILTANEAGETCFLITRRPAWLKRHANQWALPGGRLDEGEGVVEAALRETREEIGLDLDTRDVLGLLDDFPTRSGFRMTPIVAWCEPGREMTPNPEEVDRLHHVPVAELERPEVPHLWEIPESETPVLSVPMPTLDTSIHSPTAAILYQMREVALAGRHTRVAHYEQPLFAWK